MIFFIRIEETVQEKQNGETSQTKINCDFGRDIGSKFSQ